MHSSMYLTPKDGNELPDMCIVINSYSHKECIKTKSFMPRENTLVHRKRIFRL